MLYKYCSVICRLLSPIIARVLEMGTKVMHVSCIWPILPRSWSKQLAKFINLFFCACVYVYIWLNLLKLNICMHIYTHVCMYTYIKF